MATSTTAILRTVGRRRQRAVVLFCAAVFAIVEAPVVAAGVRHAETHAMTPAGTGEALRILAGVLPLASIIGLIAGAAIFAATPSKPATKFLRLSTAMLAGAAIGVSAIFMTDGQALACLGSTMALIWAWVANTATARRNGV